MAYLILKMRVTRANFHHLLKQTRDRFVTITKTLAKKLENHSAHDGGKHDEGIARVR